MVVCRYKTRLLCFIFMIIFFCFALLVMIQILINDDNKLGMVEEPMHRPPEDYNELLTTSIKNPIILWWTPLTGEGTHKKVCGRDACVVSSNRLLKDHPATEVLMFYGSNFKADDIPIPRLPRHQWALLHEESPKNNLLLSHPETIALFNHTSTFRRESDFPLTLQYLDKLEDINSTKYFVPLDEKRLLQKKLAPVVYVHSDCNVPSERDKYVQELMKHIKVDSYGECLHNRDLPQNLRNPVETMDHPDFLKIMAQYKFTLAFENAVCDDYMTEKLWRPLMLGSVPIYFGSPTVADWLPNENSAVLVEDFANPADLAKHILTLNAEENDEEYESMLGHKFSGTISNQRLIDGMNSRPWKIQGDIKEHYIGQFECFLCNRIHRLNFAWRKGFSLIKYQAHSEHYGCPEPAPPPGVNLSEADSSWLQFYRTAAVESAVLQDFMNEGRNFTSAEFHDRVLAKLNKDGL